MALAKMHFVRNKRTHPFAIRPRDYFQFELRKGYMIITERAGRPQALFNKTPKNVELPRCTMSG